jgi:hypothetical protein
MKTILLETSGMRSAFRTPLKSPSSFGDEMYVQTGEQTSFYTLETKSANFAGNTRRYIPDCHDCHDCHG